MLINVRLYQRDQHTQHYKNIIRICALYKKCILLNTYRRYILGDITHKCKYRDHINHCINTYNEFNTIQHTIQNTLLHIINIMYTFHGSYLIVFYIHIYAVQIVLF